MLFEKAFNTLEADTAKVWEQFSGYDAQTLNQPQVPGKWSAIQHMVHLNKSERSFVILLTKALKNNTPLQGNILKVNFMSRLYKIYLNFGRKIKAPKVIEPSQDFFEVEQVKKDFEKTRAQLFTLLQSITKEQIPKFWVHHLYLKELRIADLMGFMVFHQNHHRRMFGRYLK